MSVTCVCVCVCAVGQEGRDQLEEERARGGEAGGRADRLEARLEEAEGRAREAEARAEAAEGKAAKAVEVARERQRVIDGKSGEVDALKERLLVIEAELAEARERAGQDAAKLASEKRSGTNTLKNHAVSDPKTQPCLDHGKLASSKGRELAKP